MIDAGGLMRAAMGDPTLGSRNFSRWLLPLRHSA
jgi:hypothetical protein